MKELLDKLVNGEGKLSLLLLEAKEYADSSDDNDLIKFINNEINGYDKDEIPEYRKIKAEIVGTITDAYGRIRGKNMPISFSVLTKELGIDVSISYFPDGIGFIEDSLENLTSQIVERPIHIELTKMLGEIFKFNNPSLNLTSASHQFGKASIQFILTKVRQELILGLRRIGKKQKNEFNDITILNPTEDKKTVFVTYAWDGETHNDKIISFVDFLRQKGYDATMDRKESQEQTATNFNQMMINGIQNSGKVIVLLSKKYKEKADTLTGGVGFEFGIILEQLKTNLNKFIFVSFGSESIEEITPIGISGREILDLKKDQNENNFNQLFAKLESKNIINFSDVSKSKIEIKTKEIKPFKL